MVSLPFEARLLFIGLWNFADDAGRIDDEPERIKMQVFPGDQVNINEILGVLEAARRLELCESEDGDRFWQIPHFLDHQKIDHPAKSRFGEPSRKRAIPSSVRRAVAEKYGCKPGKSKDVSCLYCAAPGRVTWWSAGGWVSFTLELDHANPESLGGTSSVDNLVLACRHCNRSKGFLDASEFIARIREPSLLIGREGIKEGKGKERITALSAAPTVRPEVQEVFEVFDHWKTVMGHPAAKLDRKRKKTIEAALALGYTAEQLKIAIAGCASSAWHRGKNDRGRVYDALDLILRDAEHIDQFISIRMPAADQVREFAK